jgi:hypothetical protein
MFIYFRSKHRQTLGNPAAVENTSVKAYKIISKVVLVINTLYGA